MDVSVHPILNDVSADCVRPLLWHWQSELRIMDSIWKNQVSLCTHLHKLMDELNERVYQ